MKYMFFSTSYLFIFILIFSNITSTYANFNSKPKFVKLETTYINENLAIINDQGQKLYFNNWDGKCVLFVFWANWCAPCLNNIIELDILQKDFRRLPFEVIAISEDPISSKLVEQFFDQEDIRNLKIYYDFNHQFFKKLNIVGLPTSLIIDANGQILYKFVGSIDWFNPEIRKILLSAIPGTHEMPKFSVKEKSLNQIIKSKKILNNVKVEITK